MPERKALFRWSDRKVYKNSRKPNTYVDSSVRVNGTMDY